MTSSSRNIIPRDKNLQARRHEIVNDYSISICSQELFIYCLFFLTMSPGQPAAFEKKVMVRQKSSFLKAKELFKLTKEDKLNSRFYLECRTRSVGHCQILLTLFKMSHWNLKFLTNQKPHVLKVLNTRFENFREFQNSRFFEIQYFEIIRE